MMPTKFSLNGWWLYQSHFAYSLNHWLPSSTTEINSCLSSWVGSDYSQFIMSHSLLPHRVCLMYWRQNLGKDLMQLVRKGDQDPRLDDGQDLPSPTVQGAFSRWKCPDTTCGGVVLTPTTSLRSRWAGIRSSHSRETAKQNYSWCYTVCTTIFCLMQIQLGDTVNFNSFMRGEGKLSPGTYVQL